MEYLSWLHRLTQLLDCVRFDLSNALARDFKVLANLLQGVVGVATDSELGVLITDFIATIKARYSTFGHGLMHGFFIALMLVLPIFATNAMFERKGFKYIMVNWGYWAVTIMIMGGLLSKWF